MKARHPDVRDGFTLIELLAVISIIVLLAAALVVAVSIFTKKAQTSRTWSTIKITSQAIDAFHQDFGVYPPEFQGSMNAMFFANENVGSNPFNKGSWRPPYRFMVYGNGQYNYSSEILYYFLYKRIHDETDPNVLDILPSKSPYVEFPDYAVKDVDDDGLMEIADGWGNPLLYVAKDLYSDLGETQYVDENIEPHKGRNESSYSLYSYGADGMGYYAATEAGELDYPVQHPTYNQTSMQTAINQKYPSGDSVAQANRDNIENWQSQ